MDEQPSKPAVVSTQHTLDFSNLGPDRFEDLCLRIAMLQYGLLKPEHIGRAGGDSGADILGHVQENGESMLVSIQCKRYKKMPGSVLVRALEEFKKGYPSFSGQFWIITSGVVSKNAREQFAMAASKQNLQVDVIDGSVLEAHIRNSPKLLEEFFSIPSSPFKQSLQHAAVKIIKHIEKLKNEFLVEHSKSSSGDYPFVIDRQKVMGQVLNNVMSELKPEMAIFPDQKDDLDDVDNATVAVINNYRTWAQTTSEGLPFFGTDASSKALSEDIPKTVRFKEACEKLSTLMRVYLLS